MADLARPSQSLAVLKSGCPIPMASPRSIWTVRSTKNTSGGKWVIPSFLIGLSGENGSTLHTDTPIIHMHNPSTLKGYIQSHVSSTPEHSIVLTVIVYHITSLSAPAPKMTADHDM